MTDPVVTDITGTRKIIILSLVGVVIVLALVAAVIPDARTYCTDMVKIFLNSIPAITK